MKTWGLFTLLALSAFATVETSLFEDEESDVTGKSATVELEPETLLEEDIVESRIGVQTQFHSNCPPSVVCNAGERCIMYLGYPNCFIPATVCQFMRCLNGGTCTDNTCICVPPFTGYLCGDVIPVPRCPPGYCRNGGTCYEVGFQYRCACPSTHTGPRCDATVNPESSCPSGYCQNGGTCYFTEGQFRCVCSILYTGANCEQLVPCPPALCQNGGTCYADGSRYRCECQSPWQGPRCESQQSLVCDSASCSGDCVCQESCRHEDGYVCISNTGYLGRQCNIPVPDLQCTSNEIIITVSQQFYAEWDANQANTIIYMSPTVDGVGSTLPQCRAQLVGSTYRISMSHPYTQCGTQTSSDVGPDGFNSVSFTNALWINKNFGSTGFSYDMPFGIIRFRCIYANSYTIYTSIKPLMDVPPIITDDLQYQVSATLCKVSTCNSACPASLTVQQSAVYTVGQTLHIDFGVSQPGTSINNLQQSNAVATIQYAVLSCSSSDPFGSQQGSQFQLLENGCPTEHGRALAAEMGASTLDHRACFSFRLPRSKVCSELYIHVRLHVCPDAVQTSCPDGASAPRCNRGKRSILDDTDGRNIVVGPVYVLEEEEGNGKVTFLLDKSVVEIGSDKVGNNTHVDVYKEQKPGLEPKILPSEEIFVRGYPLLFSACGVLLVVVIIFIFIIYNRHCRNLKPESLGLPLSAI